MLEGEVESPLRFGEPRSVVDLLWARATLTHGDGNESIVHVPALYAGSAAESDARLKLGRMTCWQERCGTMRGVGQRLLHTRNGGDEEHPILSLRDLQFGDEPADCPDEED